MAHANDQLRDFTGTTQWFRHFTGYTYTEGVKAMAEQFSAYWFIDLVMSHQTNSKVRAQEFQTWELKRIGGDRFLAAATDGNDNIIAKQDIPFSDFAADTLKLYFTDGVLLLPSEY
jgi:hypothetical protein